MTPRLVLVACLGFCLWVSCKNESTLNSNLLPKGLVLDVVSNDTTTFISYTVREQKLRTDNISNYLIGVYQDPIFGKTIAELYTQFRLPTNNIDMGDNVVLDSIVLSLDYNGSYGDISIPQSLKVYKITEEMNPNRTYFSNKVFAHEAQPVGVLWNHVHNLTDSIIAEDDTKAMPPQLRIRLDDSFGQDLIDKSKTIFTNNDAFLDYFKGLYIQADSNQLGGGMLYYKPLSTFSRLTIYSNSTTDSVLHLNIDNNSATSNYFSHNYKNWEVEQFITNPDTVNGESVLYLQSNAGLKSKIFFPSIKNLDSVLINKAELVITIVDDDFSKTYPPPGKLLVLRVDSLNENDFLLDQFEDISYYGGSKKTEVDSNGIKYIRYRFNLARHVQQIVNGTIEDYGLFLLTFPSPEIANRVIVGGNINMERSIKLNLIYTRYD